jgi:hypothetical protein
MVELLCGDDDTSWEEATASALAAIEARVKLWDEILISLSTG